MEGKAKKSIKRGIKNKQVEAPQTVEDLYKEIERLKAELKAAAEKAGEAKEDAKVDVVKDTEVFDVTECGVTARTLRVGSDFWIMLMNADGNQAWYLIDPVKKSVLLTDPAVVALNEKLLTNLNITPCIPEDIQQFWRCEDSFEDDVEDEDEDEDEDDPRTGCKTRNRCRCTDGPDAILVGLGVHPDAIIRHLLS